MVHTYAALKQQKCISLTVDSSGQRYSSQSGVALYMYAFPYYVFFKEKIFFFTYSLKIKLVKILQELAVSEPNFSFSFKKRYF